MEPRNGVDGVLITVVSSLGYWLNVASSFGTMVSLIFGFGILSGVFFIARAMHKRIRKSS